MQERIKQHPEIMEKRKQIVEHPFGTIKFWNHQNSFLMKGLENVKAEFDKLVKSHLCRHSGRFRVKPGRNPERVEITGFRVKPGMTKLSIPKSKSSLLKRGIVRQDSRAAFIENKN